jgi:hypothetical protein
MAPLLPPESEHPRHDLIVRDPLVSDQVPALVVPNRVLHCREEFGARLESTRTEFTEHRLPAAAGEKPIEMLEEGLAVRCAEHR